MSADSTDLSPIAPLRNPVFRMLWTAWLAANICMWMSDVGAAWMMTSLTTTPIWVALVQTASSLPMFLLGLPSGALADNLDRKNYLLFTQVWIAAVSALLSTVIFLDMVSPPLLLALIFANGIGLAMRWPVFAAIVPELVPRLQLPAALALNGVSMNASRIIGPLVAGALIASAGSAYVFLLNTLLSVGAAVAISRWKREHKPNPLGREKLTTAVRVGWQYMAQSYHLKGGVLRICIFFFHSVGVLSLLPLLARRMEGGGAGTFTLLLAAMGLGAIAVTWFLPSLRQRFTRDVLVLLGCVVQGLSMAVLAWSDQIWICAPAMFFGGVAWLASANTLSLSVQLGLPDWVRARGMSIFQMAIMGANAAGAALWGQIATWSNVQTSLSIASFTGILGMWLLNKWWPDKGVQEDLTPNRIFEAPKPDAPPRTGRVMITIEYQIDPARSEEFRQFMLNEIRVNRLKQGALSWELLHDLNDPSRFVEMVVDESWNDFLRRFDRITVTDVALRDRKLAFHIGAEEPKVTRSVMETTVKPG